MKNKQLIEEIQNEVVKILATDKSNVRIERQIAKALIARVEKGLKTNSKDIEKIIKKYDTNVKQNATLYYALSIIVIILTRTLTQKEKEFYKPIIALTAMYSLKLPKMFARKIYQISTGDIPKKAQKVWSDFVLKNENRITESIRANYRGKVRIKSKIYTDMKYKKLSAKKLTIKYNDFKRVQTAISTEAHADLESVKRIQAKSEGYRFKTWITQRDDRVRDTVWHNYVANKKIPIDGIYEHAGMRASYPGDVLLPIGERIRCRCYLVYS